MSPRLDPKERRALMARFRSTDTKPELVLRRALRSAGLAGYRVHLRTVTGKPDLAFTRWRVAVFVDGSFWHGHPDVFQFGTKGDYWDKKIHRNQQRDRFVTAALASDDWLVVRLWDRQVLQDTAGGVELVARALAERGRLVVRAPSAG